MTTPRRALMSRNAIVWTGWALIGWALCTGHAKGETVTLGAIADTCLFELNPNYNFGGQSEAPAGTLGSMGQLKRSRMLIKFDIAGAVPEGATILSAEMRLVVAVSPSSGRANSDFGLYRVEADWGEGDKTGGEPGGAPASPGEATWNHRFEPSADWGLPGGGFEDDFSGSLSADARVFGDGTYVFDFEPKGIEDLVSMMQNPAGNFGWVLITQSEDVGKTARRWATRENPNPSRVPQLEIHYALPVAPPEPEVVSVVVDDNSVAIRFWAEAGVGYSLESGTDLNAAVWEVSSTIAAEAVREEKLFSVPRGSGGRLFFRIRATVESD